MPILDSGERRQFESGAVRDIREGKGRCDLLPLDIIARLLADDVFYRIQKFIDTDDVTYLYNILGNHVAFYDIHTMILEVSKHFEEGCIKYGERNWQKGIPTHCYIDSAVRHYIKYRRGDTDEPHDRAFIWNILCCIWTVHHKPELDDYREEGSDEKSN